MGPRDRRARQHYRGLHLAPGDPPVGGQQAILLLWRDRLEAVAAVEADRPLRRGPGSYQHRPLGTGGEVLEQPPADPFALPPRAHISVADEVDVADWLDTHHAGQL